MKHNIIFKITFLYLIFAVITVKSYTQVYSSGWAKELLHNPKRYNTYLTECHYNTHFRTSIKTEDTLVKKLDSEILRLNNKYSAIKPLKIEDCIYFNPLEKYVGNMNNLQFTGENKSFFYLNKVYKNKPQYPSESILPYSLRFYLLSDDVSVVPGQLELLLKEDFAVPEEDYIKPFYFRKYEVTNKEYREFVEWVKDSIIRQTLYDAGIKTFGTTNKAGKVFLNFNEPIDFKYPQYSEILEKLYYLESERFYTRKVFDVRHLGYRYIEQGDKAVYELLCNVYPDTLCWVKDFTYSFNEPMTNHYFWHPAYDDYPVVGVSYWQALAFLHWKTIKHQKELLKKGIKARIKYDLPSEIQWDIAATAEIEDKKISIFTSNYNQLSDKSWVCDLKLTNNKIERTDSITDKYQFITTREDQLFELINTQSTINLNTSFHSLHTHRSYIDLKGRNKKKNEVLMLNKDALGICFMGGNVSEWLKDSYSQWATIFDLRQKQLETFEEEDIKALSAIEKYYNQRNAAEGKLVRGSNWYDQRFSNISGKNIAGINTKTFIDPDRTHSTIGFRYVIYIEPIETGTNLQPGSKQ